MILKSVQQMLVLIFPEFEESSCFYLEFDSALKCLPEDAASMHLLES